MKLTESQLRKIIREELSSMEDVTGNEKQLRHESLEQERTIQKGDKFLLETGMMNKQKYIFIFSNADLGLPRAIFPIEMEKEAMAFRDKGNGYFEARVGNWSGFGEFPSIRNLKLLP